MSQPPNKNSSLSSGSKLNQIWYLHALLYVLILYYAVNMRTIHKILKAVSRLNKIPNQMKNIIVVAFTFFSSSCLNASVISTITMITTAIRYDSSNNFSAWASSYTFEERVRCSDRSIELPTILRTPFIMRCTALLLMPLLLCWEL